MWRKKTKTKIMSHAPCVTCLMSQVTFHISPVTSILLPFTNTNSHRQRPSPAKSFILDSKMVCKDTKKLRKNSKAKVYWNYKIPHMFKGVPIWDIYSSTRSLQSTKQQVLSYGTHKHTYRWLWDFETEYARFSEKSVLSFPILAIRSWFKSLQLFHFQVTTEGTFLYNINFCNYWILIQKVSESWPIKNNKNIYPINFKWFPTLRNI